MVRGAGHSLVQADPRSDERDEEAGLRAHDLHRQERLLLLGGMLTAPLVVFSMARDFGLVGFAGDQVAMMVPATLVQFVVGASFYRSAWNSLRARKANMDVPSCWARRWAYLSSMAVTLGWPGAPACTSRPARPSSP